MKQNLGRRNQQSLSGNNSTRWSERPVAGKYVEWTLKQTCYLTSLVPSNYVIMVTMFFTVSVINNYSLNFNIAMPLHMIFRSVRAAFYLLLTFYYWVSLIWHYFHISPESDVCLVSLQGSLIANMILGIIILKKRYTFLKTMILQIWYSHVFRLKSIHLCLPFFSPCRYTASKYMSIALISAGIFICTIMSAKQVVSPLFLSVYQYKTSSLSKCMQHWSEMFLRHFVILFLQNVATEGSEEQGFYPLIHWLIGELHFQLTIQN